MASTKQPADSSAIRLTAHPPEHHHRGKPVTLACGCCCCCCCCLHSVGSLIGGIIGSVKRIGPLPVQDDAEVPPVFRRPRTDTRITTEPNAPDLPSPFRRRDLEEKVPLLSVGILYWLLLCFLLFLGALWLCLSTQSFRPERFFIGLLVGLGLLPLPQLGASILSAIAAVLFYEDRRAALARVGYITLYSVIGTVIGIGVMLLFIPLLSMR